MRRACIRGPVHPCRESVFQVWTQSQLNSSGAAEHRVWTEDPPDGLDCWDNSSPQLSPIKRGKMLKRELHPHLFSANTASSWNSERVVWKLQRLLWTGQPPRARHGRFSSPRRAASVRPPAALLPDRRTGAQLSGGTHSFSLRAPRLEVGPGNPSVR